jgi:transposase
MDQTWQDKWRSGAHRAAQIRRSGAIERGRSPEAPRFAGKGCGELWVSRRAMDLCTGGQIDRARVRRAVPPRPCQPHSQRPGLDAPETDPTGQTAQRSRNPALEGCALARVEKKAVEEGRTIVFIDESGVYLLPMVVRTYAPCGQTPILKEFLSYKHLSLIGAVTPQGKLFLTVYAHSITSREVVLFLGQLLRRIAGLLLVIWDGIPTHRSRIVKAYLADGAAKRIHLEQLPGYAPDLNPTEWVWSYLKLADLANIACDHLPDLEVLIKNSKRRMQRRPQLIQAFVRNAGYEL